MPIPPGTLHAPSLLDAGARFCCSLVERKLNLSEGAIYNRGLGDVLRAAIQENPAIPQQPLTAVDLARRAGILPERSVDTRKKRRIRHADHS